MRTKIIWIAILVFFIINVSLCFAQVGESLTDAPSVRYEHTTGIGQNALPSLSQEGAAYGGFMTRSDRPDPGENPGVGGEPTPVKDNVVLLTALVLAFGLVKRHKLKVK